MPETTLHPTGQRKADAVVAQPVVTPYQALRQLGWITPIDFIIMFLIVGVGVTLFFWHLFGTPTAMNRLSCALLVFALFQFWTVLLIFRCARFVLDVTAYLNTLPEEAARIVMAAYSGRTLPPRK